MIKLIKIIWEYLIPVFTPLLIYYCTFEIPLNFKIVPAEYIFEFNVAIYSSIIVGLRKIVNYLLKQYKKKFSNILVITSDDDTNFINRYLELNFKNDFVKLFVQIKISGEPDKLKKKEISMFFPPQVNVQLTKSSKKYCHLDENGKCIKIDVSKLFNTNKNNTIFEDSATFDIEVMKIDEIVESSAEISLTKGNVMTTLDKNEIYFKK